MTTQQPEALRLADWLDDEYEVPSQIQVKAAAELRRLHARDKEWESVTGFMQTTTDRIESELLRLHTVNKQLLEALEGLKMRFPTSEELHAAGWNQADIDEAYAAYDEARSAIAAAKEKMK